MNSHFGPTWKAPWFLWSLLAVLSWGIWAAMSKLLGDALSAEQSQSLSTLGMLPVIVALLGSKRLHSHGHRRRGIIWALSAGLLSCLGNTAYYQLLRGGAKAATVVPLTALYPLVTLIFAVTFLGERLNRIQMGGILLSLVAIYLFNVPSESGLASSPLTLALLPIGFWGLAGLLQKMSTNEISGEFSTLVFLAVFVPVAAFLIWHQPLAWAAVTGRTWFLVTTLGLCFALGNFALLEAFAREGKASVITPLTGLYPLVSVPIAILFLGERIGPREVGGIIVALLSVCALSLETPRPSPTVPSS